MDKDVLRWLVFVLLGGFFLLWLSLRLRGVVGMLLFFVGLVVLFWSVFSLVL